MHLRAAELLLVDLVAHAGAAATRRTAGEHLARSFTMMEKCEAAGLERAGRRKAERDGDDRYSRADRPWASRVARDFVPPCCSTRRTRRQRLARGAGDGQCDARRSCPHRSASRRRSPRMNRRGSCNHRRRARSCGRRSVGADDGVRRPHVDEVAFLVVLALARHHADLEPRSGSTSLSIRSRAVKRPPSCWRRLPPRPAGRRTASCARSRRLQASGHGQV
jgi:hypothetical protein